LGELHATITQLQAHELGLRYLEMNARGSWRLTLSNDIVVALGAPPFEDKIERMAAVLEGASQENQARIKAIDARYPNGLAIEWKASVNTDGEKTKK